MICYLLNGWRCPPALLMPLTQALEASGLTAVLVPDVPLAAWQNPSAWQSWVSSWYRHPGCLIGWSHGGTIAWQIAQQRADVLALLTLATGPHFVRQSASGDGLDSATFAQFYAMAEEQPALCLQRFQALMVQDDDAHKVLRRQLKAAYAERSTISDTELLALRHLANTDLTSCVLPATCHRSHWFGANDALVPASVAKQLPNSRVFPGVGHCLPLRLVPEIVRQLQVWSAL
ncbi:MAG: hypothetical protein JXQ97_16030 [Natronospirillum sp.]